MYTAIVNKTAAIRKEERWSMTIIVAKTQNKTTLFVVLCIYIPILASGDGGKWMLDGTELPE